MAQDTCYAVDQNDIRKIKADAKAAKRAIQVQRIEELKENIHPSLKRAVDLSTEKGVSTWLSVLPIDEYGFCLHKSAFRDALCLRYAWPIKQAPQSCVCGKKFDVDHSMMCSKGGFPTIRHNEVRDLTADLLTEVCYDVEVEPKLQELTGEHIHLRSANTDDGARLDVRARGFWGHSSQCAFFDVRIFIQTHKAICPPAYLLPIESMKLKRNASMASEYVM